MSDSITFKYTLTEGDAVRVVRFENTYSKFFWLVMAVVALMFAYNLFANTVLALQGQKNWYPVLRALLFFGALFGAWGAFIWYLPVWIARRWPGVGIEREVIATNDSITVRGALEYTESVWENYTDVLETNYFFLLRMGVANTLAIPKRPLAEISAVSGFREFLRAHCAVYRRV